MNAPKATIYVVEDDASFRTSVERLIRAMGWDVVSFGTATAFLGQAKIRRPACLLLDVRLPDVDGMDLQQRLLEQGMNLPIIFMTGHGSIPMGVEAMKKGAVDFLPKPFDTEDLLRAVREALARDVQDEERALRKSEVQGLMDTLTPREMEVLRWVIAGKLNKQIARSLGIGEKTVKVHRGRVMEKTRVSSVAELVRLAELAGIDPAT